jgi:hypothetical protein
MQTDRKGVGEVQHLVLAGREVAGLDPAPLAGAVAPFRFHEARPARRIVGTKAGRVANGLAQRVEILGLGQNRAAPCTRDEARPLLDQHDARAAIAIYRRTLAESATRRERLTPRRSSPFGCCS